MELRFQSDIDFQLDAIESVVDLFKSQKFGYEKFFLLPESGIISNRLDITREQILLNLRDIQNKNKIKQSEELQGMHFSIEMETGTGKTYVYLRTIFQLNKSYGFKKFIIIVPSVAIKEGVLKTLKITERHFKELFQKTPYSYYEYDSRRINFVRQFSRSNKMEIMVMTVNSFNKDINIINQERDVLFGQKPIDLVSRTNPILILDEPQNMQSEIATRAIDNLNPLFTLRYSATHRVFYNLIYRLTPIDAYTKNLVKKIEVLSVVKENDFNNVFLRCREVKAKSNGISAKIVINKKMKNGIKLAQLIVKGGEELSAKTGLSEYSGFTVTEINAKDNYVKFSNGLKLNQGEEVGGDMSALMKIQIKETIEEHLIKYSKLKKMGIKVLSLFFIDRVDNYISENGIIRKFFIEEFDRLKKGFEDFKHMNSDDVHAGYFSRLKTDAAMEEDRDTFDLIMRDKERLLSFDEPVQFIFSHSALREGWDNPNVFNICTLNQTVSDIKKRQEIGRGMRLPVNQDGERVLGEQNVLTVVANESYNKYVSKLQTEYVDEYGEELAPPKPQNVRNRAVLKLKKYFQLNPEFKELWKRVSRRTKYAIEIDSSELIRQCISKINSTVTVDSIKVKIETVELQLEEGKGVVTSFKGVGYEYLDKSYSIHNVIDYISEETRLTRKTIITILNNITNLGFVFRDPQEFISSVVLIIKEVLADFLVNGIKYLEVDDWYKLELFNEIKTYANIILPVEKSIYDGIIFNSDVEKNFAEGLERMTNVRLFIKLPAWFVVDTPIGQYNPDWAIVIDHADEHGKIKQKLYFVTETKGKMDIGSLRISEKRKIACAKKHFETLDVDYKVVDKPEKIQSN